jgi:hypothetical protein
VTSSRGLRYIVTGDRNWSDWGLVRRFVDVLPPGSTVIHGDARGLDSMVERVLTTNRPTRARQVRVHGEDGTIGRRRGGSSRGDVDVEVYPADWDRYRYRVDRETGEVTERTGRNPAGAIRNRRMLKDGLPDRCVWFHHNLAESRGTADMVKVATEGGVAVWEASEFIDYMRHGEAADADE